MRAVIGGKFLTGPVAQPSVHSAHQSKCTETRRNVVNITGNIAAMGRGMELVADGVAGGKRLKNPE